MNFQNRHSSFVNGCSFKLRQVESFQVYTMSHWLFTFNEKKLFVHRQEHVLFKIKAKSFDRELRVHLSKFQVFRAISRYWLHQVLYLNVSHLFHKAFTSLKRKILLIKASVFKGISILYNIKSKVKCLCIHTKTSFFSEFLFKSRQCTSNCSLFGCSLRQNDCL